MKIYSERPLADFEPWSGAVRVYDRIYNAGLLEHLESILEEEYPDGIDETELDDLFWFESDYIYGLCGLRTEDEIREDLADTRSQHQDLMSDYILETEEIEAEWTAASVEELKTMWQELYDEEYRDEIEELERTIADLERELDEA